MSDEMITVTVFGLGFVGLTTALGFADMGYKVYGVDIDAGRKDTLRKGELPFSEPHMRDVLREQLGKNFTVTDDPASAVRESEYIFYCVGTPYSEDGSADLRYLFSAIDSTVDALVNEYGDPIDGNIRLMITKSTIPPSTTSDKIVPYVASKGKISKNIGIANNPEFLREGHCWDDFMNADRIIVGCDDDRTKDMMDVLYRPMNVPKFFVSHNTGEFIKYLSNTILATLISYSNEMATIADTIGGIDIPKAFNILHMDKRWNGCAMTSYVYPGCGYGGYCLPKDTNAMLAQSKNRGFEPQILKEVIATNENRPRMMANMISNGLDKNNRIGILGLSFKPGSDDVRDTPALKIIKELQKKGYEKISAYDPVANKEFSLRYPEIKITIRDNMKELYDESDVMVIVTAWNEFRMIREYGNKRVIDCRYML
ncbi:MAG: UDP-glucose/GDP-mannose dehydrogenase family protein [Methanomassiliicoccaceae archaeon]|jgi:UDPglucose 6-dehydrogenase|nr:UDP-glucose/GDP-mannose dehydrogenase family protein [Methanomassiliicoccaceae archaeon]